MYAWQPQPSFVKLLSLKLSLECKHVLLNSYILSSVSSSPFFLLLLLLLFLFLLLFFFRSLTLLPPPPTPSSFLLLTEEYVGCSNPTCHSARIGLQMNDCRKLSASSGLCKSILFCLMTSARDVWMHRSTWCLISFHLRKMMHAGYDKP